MAAIVIFVEGADTEPDPLPVYILDNQEHATLICEGLKESEYRIFNFSIKHCTRSDRGRFAVWAEMTIDARDGVYGSIAAGIYDLVYRAHEIISQRRVHQKSLASSNGNTQSDGGSVLPSSTQLPLYDNDAHVGVVELSDLIKLCTSPLRHDNRRGTLYRDEAGSFIYHVWDNDENSIGRECQLMRPADAYEVALNAEQFFVEQAGLIASLAELKVCAGRTNEGGGSLAEKASEVSPATTESDADTETKTREEQIAALDVRHKHAIVAFELAQNAIASPGERFTREKAWVWVEEHYEDYPFPSRQAFMDYVTQARGKLGENVNQPRRGRSGRSVVRQSEL